MTDEATYAALIGMTVAALVVGLIMNGGLIELRVKLAAATTMCQAAEQDRDYWRTRCESLLDAQLVRSTGGPVMAPAAPASNDPTRQLLAGMSMTEFDSRKRGSPSPA